MSTVHYRPVDRIDHALHFRAAADIRTPEGVRIATIFGYTTMDGGAALSILDSRIDRIAPHLDGASAGGSAASSLHDQDGLPVVTVYGDTPDEATFRVSELAIRIAAHEGFRYTPEPY